MITEIAQIEIKPGTEKDYEAAVAKAVALPPIGRLLRLRVAPFN